MYHMNYENIVFWCENTVLKFGYPERSPIHGGSLTQKYICSIIVTTNGKVALTPNHKKLTLSLSWDSNNEFRGEIFAARSTNYDQNRI